MRKITSLVLPPLSAIALAVSGGSVIAAEGANDAEMEEVVITGFRGKPR